MSNEVRPTEVRVGQRWKDHSGEYVVINGPREDDGRFECHWQDNGQRVWYTPMTITVDRLVGMVDAPGEVPKAKPVAKKKAAPRECVACSDPTSHPGSDRCEFHVFVAMHYPGGLHRHASAFTADVTPSRYPRLERPARYPEVDPLHWLEDV